MYARSQARLILGCIVMLSILSDVLFACEASIIVWFSILAGVSTGVLDSAIVRLYSRLELCPGAFYGVSKSCRVGPLVLVMQQSSVLTYHRLSEMT